MVRHRMQCEVVYGRFREVLEAWEELNAISRASGWKESIYWVPTVGQANVLVAETDYAGLEEFHRESEAQYSDPAFMKIVRSTNDKVVQGSVRDELLELAPHLA